MQGQRAHEKSVCFWFCCATKLLQKKKKRPGKFLVFVISKCVVCMMGEPVLPALTCVNAGVGGGLFFPSTLSEEVSCCPPLNSPVHSPSRDSLVSIPMSQESLWYYKIWL